MEKTEQLKKHIYDQIQAGMNPDEITSQLKTAGWDEHSIASAFAAVRAQITPTELKAAKDSPVNDHVGVQFQASGQKRGRIKTAWLLMKQSFKVLKKNKQLMRYPLMATVLALLITIVFGLIGYLGGDTFYHIAKDVFGDEDIRLTGPGNVLAFVYYVLVFFVVFIYNAGLAAHVLDIFRGKSQNYLHYMKIAWSKRKPIFVYSLITTTVGLILRAIEQRARWLGWIVSRILGTLWSLANLFTIPVIVETDSSAPSAIKQSAKLFTSRWGENISARIGFGGLMFLLYLLVLSPVLILTAFLTSSFGLAGFVVFVVIAILSILLFATIETAASNILSTALYYYARYEQVPAAFDADLLNSALVPKKKKRRLFGKKTPVA